MTDRLSGPIMEGEIAPDEIGEQAWAIYATSYWGGMELREHWGMPPALKNIGMTPPEPPFTEVQQGMVHLMTQRMTAVRAGGEACLQLLPAILREPSPSAPIYPPCDTGFQRRKLFRLRMFKFEFPPPTFLTRFHHPRTPIPILP